MIIALLLSLIFAFVALGLGVLLLAICAVAALCRCKMVADNPFKDYAEDKRARIYAGIGLHPQADRFRSTVFPTTNR